MSKWTAEAQAKSLKYGAYISLISGVYFTIMLISKWLELAGKDVGEWPSILMVLVALLFVGVVTRMSTGSHKLAGGWREMFGIYSDEFTRETSRKANARAFVGLIIVLIPGVLIGENLEATHIGSYVTVSTYSLTLIVVGTLVWSLSVLWEMRDQGDDDNG
ncbi:hypothetical protein LG272_01465 [Pseudidiomarina marina]|uniref:hypothetical protein n=1 Tax=Pseudidiomarina marina TaxID=502366 RepID=UPI00385154CA